LADTPLLIKDKLIEAGNVSAGSATMFENTNDGI